MARVARKTNSKLWQQSKKMACTVAGLCNHSARKMQWAVRYYKSKGGKYSRKSRSDNSLRKWSREKWRTSSGKKSGGKRRYLPAKAWNNLSKSEKRRTNLSKAKGYSRGKQWVRQPKDIARKTRRYRSGRKTRR